MNQGVKNMPAPADHETTVVKKADKKPQRKKANCCGTRAGFAARARLG
jgi:hypothetical protein